MQEVIEPRPNETEKLLHLTERQRAILRLIVHEYVSTGRPVASKNLTEHREVGYSSATIRNEMAELEQTGLVEHFHTSGGRVPTSLGYRFFVKNLMSQADLPDIEQQTIRQLFRQAEVQLEAWTDLAAAVLAEIAGNVSVVTAPRTAVARLRHMELISLQPGTALLILVTFESTVRQVMIHLPSEANQEALSRLADRLTTELRGLTGFEIATRARGADENAKEVIQQLERTLISLDEAGQSEVSSSGLHNVVGRADFDDSDLQAMLDLMKGGQLLRSIVPLLRQGTDVQVFIGDDVLPDSLRKFGLIVAPYGSGEEVTGMLGILGPTRMAYWRSISTVRYMARLMSDLVSELIPAEE